MEEIFKRYEDLGFYVVPVAHKGKAPLLDPAKYASNSAKQMIEWYHSKKYVGCNWGLMPAKSGLVIVDVDARDGGIELWQTLSSEEKIHTMVQRSARGGFHFLFKAKPGVKYKKPLTKKGIDTQFNNIIVIFPSKLKEGQQYSWIEENPIQEMPESFEKMFAATHDVENEPVDFIGIEKFIAKIAEQLKTKKFGYDEWIQIGMAIHSSLPTSAGLKLWQDISSGVNAKDGDIEACAYKWSGFTSKGGLTARSLSFIARELGCEVPSLTLEQDKMEFATERQRRVMEAENNPGWFTDKSGSIVSVHKDFIIDDLNRQGYFIEGEANAGRIGRLNVSNNGYKTVTFMKPADFRLQTATHFYKVYSDKTFEYVKIADIWIKSPKRQQYDRIIFSHEDEDGALNLWSPLPCVPMKGDVSLFHQLIFAGLAGGNIDKGLWLLDWLAHIVQRPEERCSLVPVLIGDQGTGKGILFDRIMQLILGSYHYKINTARVLKERFNAEQACKFLTLIDEASWRGDKEEDGILKGLTGSAMMTVEQKFGGRFAVNNYSRYIVLSNNPEAISIERSNRRYVVFEVNNEYAKQHAFFARLADKVKDGHLANAIFESLLARDITKFNSHKLPQFEDGQGHQAKVASEGVEAEFWNHLWNHEPKELWLDEDTLLKDVAFSEFIQYSTRMKTHKKSLSAESFWRKTNAYFKVENESRTRVRIKGQRREVLKIAPKKAIENFCEILKLKKPYEFDPTDYIFSDESKIMAVQ